MDIEEKNQKNTQFSFTRSLVRGEFHFGFWYIIQRGVGLFNTFFIISALTVYQYGVFHLILSTYAIFSAFLGLGAGVVHNDLLRLISEEKRERAKRLFIEYYRLVVGLGILAWAAAFFGSPLLKFRYQDDFILIVKIMSFMFLIDAIYIALRELLMVDLKFAAVASRKAAQKALIFISLIAFHFYSGVQIPEVLISMIIGALGSVLLMIGVIIKSYQPWKNVKAGKESILFSTFRTYGKWDIVRQFTARNLIRLQPWLIKFFISTEAVGIWGVVVSMVDFAKGFMPIKTLSTLIPRASANTRILREVFVYGGKYLFMGALVSAGIAGIGGIVVINLFFEKYIVALPYFLAFIYFLPIHVVRALMEHFLVLFRKQKYIFFAMITINGALLGIMAVLMPWVGLWGVVIAEYMTGIVLVSVNYWYLSRIQKELGTSFGEVLLWGKRDRELFRVVLGQVRGFVLRGLKSKQ